MISLARETFLKRLNTLSSALADPLLIDLAPHLTDHNDRARILRNGLAIVAFNALEDFIKNRISELYQKISASALSFYGLPEPMQRNSLLQSLKGMQTVGARMYKNNENWLGFIEQEARKLASTAATPFEMSWYGIGWEKSNIDADDMSGFLKVFHVDGNWTFIQHVTVASSCSIPSPKDFFQNAASRRHDAAHNPLAASLHADLENYATTAKALAFAFDCGFSHASKMIITANVPYSTGRKVLHGDILLRFIRKVGNDFKEMSQGNTTVIAIHPDMATAVAAVRARTNYNGEFIVVLDYPSKMHNWYTAL